MLQCKLFGHKYMPVSLAVFNLFVAEDDNHPPVMVPLFQARQCVCCQKRDVLQLHERPPAAIVTLANRWKEGHEVSTNPMDGYALLLRWNAIVPVAQVSVFAVKMRESEMVSVEQIEQGQKEHAPKGLRLVVNKNGN